MKALKLIKYLRNKGLEGQELAEAAGTTRATISRIESGKIEKLNINMLEKAAHFLNKTPDELLSEIE